MQKTKKVVNFGKINPNVELPNLVEVQLNSFEWFLQAGLPQKKRLNQGLNSVFGNIFPIESPHEDLVLEFIDYEVGDPKYSEAECKERDVTYATPLKSTIRLIKKDSMEVREQSVYMGDIPLMTERGTFIINGAERVVVNQLHRSPGIFFAFDDSNRVYSSRVIPDKGSWLEIEMDSKGFLIARIDRKKKFPVSIIVKALGYETNEEIIKLFYDTSDVALSDEEAFEQILGRRVAADVVSAETGEVIIDAGNRINIDTVDIFKEENVKTVELINFPNNKDDIYLITTLQKDADLLAKQNVVDAENLTQSQIALLTIHELMRPGEPSTLENAENEFFRLFFNPKTYTLGNVGRYKINKKFGYDDDDDSSTLTKRDILQTIKYVFYLIAEANGFLVDDIDHLGNRRVRSVGELLTNQIKVGFQRMERVIKERMTIQDLDLVTPQALISIKPISAVINEFFGSSQLSQFMDQTNPLSELTHKRRLNALGPGGLSRDRAGFEVRDVHHTHYGRMCPIETPEGPNIGLILSMSTYSRINDYGFLETPYKIVKDGIVTSSVKFLTATEEDRYNVAQANASIDDEGKFTENLIPCRSRGDFPYRKGEEIQYMDVSPQQIFSVSTCLIPFLEHDDANRALMGSNMQRQAVPLLVEEAPLVGTGIETYAAMDSGVMLRSKHAGEVEYADAQVIKVRRKDTGELDLYPLVKFKRTNQGTCFNQKPAVRTGDKVKKGGILADGPSTDNGRLALGKNILVAFMPWMGYNFEDAILLSERLVKDDVYTSLHIEQFEVEARETKLGPETITRDIPNLSEKAFKDLDVDGVVRPGAYVKPNDILVGKVTPKGEQDITPEYKLLHSIFGEKAREVRDTSLRVPNGMEGVVIDIKRFSRENGDELSAGVEELVKVFIAKKRKISVGDKMAGRHGNKGVISRIMAEYDMPHLEDGTPIDIVLNPLGVPSRMNLGQLLETELGWAAHELNLYMETPIFDGAKPAEIKEYLKKAGLPEDSKATLYDGRTGIPFENRVMTGYVYILKLAHMVDDKIHARSTGPYSLVTQQPLGGKAQFGGQRLGEMEVWALEAYGAAYTLQELLTVKSDDMLGRAKMYEAIVKGHHTTSPGVPESFNVLVQELRGLALDVRIYDVRGKEAVITEWGDMFGKNRKKIKLDTIKND
ncbi:MAG: DNA-directed RNA polymerase subunit beta [Spirochaetes bacterium]|jgi:DNA-directed RNA polymerase subunit beta|nr:DNA-directed RNA polymerase subunit beta [Spirochaetota bacterium]